MSCMYLLIINYQYIISSFLRLLLCDLRWIIIYHTYISTSHPVYDIIYIIIYCQNWIISLTLKLTAQVSIIYIIIYTQTYDIFFRPFDFYHTHTYIYIYTHNNNALITAVDTKRGAWQCVSTIFPRRPAKTAARGWSAAGWWWGGGPVSSANH